MSTVTDHLNSQLVAIQADYDDAAIQLSKSNFAEYKAIAATYIWWRDASQQSGYLDTVYASKGIENSKTGNQLNFRPLLRLASRDEITRNDLNLWNQALRRINDEYVENSDHYKFDPVDRIAHFIKTSGGKTGLANYHNVDDEFDDPIVEISEELQELNEREFLSGFLREGIDYYRGIKNDEITTSAKTESDLNSFAIIIAHKDNDKRYFANSLDDEELIKQVIVARYRSDLEALPISVRSVLEPLQLANVPRSVMSSADKFQQISTSKDPWDEKRKRIAYRQLIWRENQKDFLISARYAPVSVVITAKPKNEIIKDAPSDLFLRNSRRQSIEYNLLHQRMFNFFVPQRASEFIESPNEAIAHCYLPLIPKKTFIDELETADISMNMLSAQVTNLSHPAISFIPFYKTFGRHEQVIMKADDFKVEFEAHLNQEALWAFKHQFAERWLKSYGSKATRAENKIVQIQIDQNAMHMHFEYKADAGYQAKQRIDFCGSTSKGTLALHMVSTDFVFFVRQLSDLRIIGTVLVQADQHAIRFVFETSAMTYDCWIPACNENGVRDKKHFGAYHPIEYDENPFEMDADDLIPDETSDQAELLKKSIGAKRDPKQP